jgi:transcriptional antiterminator RfaH
MTGSFSDRLCWYGVHTKPKQEERAGNNLRAWNIETFTPKLKKQSVNNFTGQLMNVVGPLFPSYIFARFSANHSLHNVCFARGVDSVISFGGQPCPVDETIIDLIHAREDEEGFINLTETLRPGDKVTIQGGLFRGFIGVLDRNHTANERVSILLVAVSYQSRVVIDRSLAMKI